MTNRTKMAFGAGGLLLLMILIWTFGGGDGTDTPSGGSTPVRRGTLKVTLTERGTLKTRNAVHIRSAVKGRTAIEWLIEEGTRVETGDVVVELEKEETQRRIDDLEDNLIGFEIELNSSRTEVAIQTEQNKTDSEKAQLALEVAQVEREKLMAGDIPKEERRLDLSIEKAESELSRAEGLWEDMPQMLEKGFVTQDEFEQERINLKEKREGLVTAKQERELYKVFEKPLSLKQKHAAVTEAQRGVERVAKQAETKMGSLLVKVSQDERRLQESQEELERELYDIERMTIVAPSGGVVFYGNPDRSWEAEDIKVGENVYFNRVILTLPDPAEMAVSINVHEADIDKIAEGMSAVTRSDVQKDRVFHGEVIKIDSVANAGNRRWGDQIRRFKVEVSLQGNDLELKPGTSAEVEIHTADLEDILYVPLQAVHAAAGKYYCFLDGASGSARTEVTVGRSNDSFLEIIDGLEEGQHVLLYKPDSVTNSVVEESPSPQSSGERGSRPRGESGNGNRGSRGRGPTSP
ncbi:MAG: HlyD family efflux transporter periplasmic adaptor subunit [Planctomycetes bacterium]|jgi:HlyD family secretion protein|nr:HlyD family efflux transporter periplasmic adaptor subunit [Planctomycetota bacterium]MBT6452367.1 HlyD family efflux transporter periplasmic adaptor subunit [Planctomycetota bacterium]MBT6542472.1 HlyD family efflux transporter periplasmic adaptor subunit [Planctomycetota bacterium]MBT6784769.1 HlyD family efflux transporter periplasmic adaptor subunit [Planctomycetota bacterium]MBT6968978.1 HlyD family efflux transporter periplasmic adaptor subunit [Planctomycetota bacterium]